jgi:hypothetical protein
MKFYYSYRKTVNFIAVTTFNFLYVYIISACFNDYIFIPSGS